MSEVLVADRMSREQDLQISAAIQREQTRLRKFIRARVPNRSDAEDILQDVFYELVEAYRLMQPIEQVGAWLLRVARNRIIDLFRKKKPTAFDDPAEESGGLLLAELLPSADAGPDALYASAVLLEEIEHALDALPKEQRDVFISHEFEGRSFKELARQTGVSVNTLLARKRYAVLHLRKMLEEFGQE
jgi:RNA polymerase sigma factor (sigma-70 family)